MEKSQRQMKDPIFQSLKVIKERHTYQENRQQRIDKRNAEIAKELKEKNEERLRLQKLALIAGGDKWAPSLAAKSVGVSTKNIDARSLP